MDYYKEFIIRTIPNLPEIVTGILWELNIPGLVEEDDLIKVFSDDKSLTKEMIAAQLSKLKNEKLIESFSVIENNVKVINWNEEYEKSLKTIKVTDKIVITPSLQDYETPADEIVITIVPKMSFGTGHHQTTKLMIQFIEKYIKRGMKVLDIGSGSAVLAITSVKLGAGYALAIDNDELCLVNGAENVKQNNLEKSVQVRLGEINDVSESSFDMILVNIQKNVLIEIADDISKRVNMNGLVVLSGLLTDDKSYIEEVYSAKEMKLIDFRQMDEWIALVFKKG